MTASFEAAEKIGSRFSIVGFLPTLTLVAFLSVVVATGAPGSEPSLHALRANLTELGLTQVAVGCFAALVVALVVHPLQFGLVQLLEGYWPRRGLGGVVAEVLTERHRTSRKKFDDLRLEPVEDAGEEPTAGSAGFWDRFVAEEQRQTLAVARRREAQKRLETLPEFNRLMPTSLGNVLRYAEDFAGSRYGLDAIAVIPRLYPLMPPMMVELLEDSRRVLDVMVRFTANFLIATVVILVVFAGTPTWQIFALATYGLAWVSYRGCLAAARQYGEMVIAAIDLYRFELLEQMRIDLPATVAEERDINAQVMNLIHGRRFASAHNPASLRLVHPAPPTGRD